MLHIDRQQTKQDQYSFHASVLSRPHPDKIDSGGEDAFFLGTTDMTETGPLHVRKKRVFFGCSIIIIIIHH
jgi:hypothetical protein